MNIETGLVESEEPLSEARHIVVATSLIYRTWEKERTVGTPLTEDNLRGDCALQMIHKALENGYQIAVIDGGSSKDFLSELTALGVSVSKEKERGMSASRRQALSEASEPENGKVIAWFEPEKISMVDCLWKLCLPILHGEADIVVPERTEESFGTYTLQQAKSEKRFNHFWNKVLRLAGLLKGDDPDLDVAFGPKIFRNKPEILALFLKQYSLRKGSKLESVVKPDAYSNATFFPIISALHKGFKVRSIPVNYRHPENQTEFENAHPERYERKRNTQKKDIVWGAVELVRSLINDPKKQSELEQVPKNPSIDVESYVRTYGIENEAVIEALNKYPVLCYLLGSVTNQSQGTDSHPDHIERSYFILQGGSGLFELRNKDDATRWKGIFNHIIGSAGQVMWLAERLQTLTDAQKQQFAERGFDIATLDQLDPEFLRDFMLVSHAGRRQMDEYIWHNLRDAAHPSDDSGKNTKDLLDQLKADPRLIELMRVEMHAGHLAGAGESGVFFSFLDNILTYCDWTYAQSPMPLGERFEGLRKSKRASEDVLSVLEKAGFSFEKALQTIVDPDIFEHMRTRKLYNWEQEIRFAYCVSAGLTIDEVFPQFAQAWEKQSA